MNRSRKKGFTLIEMLVVIAIVAVLTAIIIPIVGSSTLKSAAATNAANLRAVKGQLVSMRALYPSQFKTLLDTPVGDVVSGFWGPLLDLYGGEGYGDQVMAGAYRTFTATSDGTLTLYAPDIVLTNVPASKEVTVQGENKSDSIVMEKGIPMSVLITETDVFTAYGAYSIEHFADVAEDGKLNEHTIKPSYSGDGGVFCQGFGHRFGADGKCLLCPYDSGYHNHASTDGDTRCDDCGMCVGGHIDGIIRDGYCDTCGTPISGTAGNHTHNYGNDHKCTVAGCLARESCNHLNWGKCKCGGTKTFTKDNCPNC